MNERNNIKKLKAIDAGNIRIPGTRKNAPRFVGIPINTVGFAPDTYKLIQIQIQSKTKLTFQICYFTSNAPYSRQCIAKGTEEKPPPSFFVDFIGGSSKKNCRAHTEASKVSQLVKISTDWRLDIE